MTTTTVFVRIEYDYKMSMEQEETLFKGIKGGLGEIPVLVFYFECSYDEENED